MVVKGSKVPRFGCSVQKNFFPPVPTALPQVDAQSQHTRSAADQTDSLLRMQGRVVATSAVVPRIATVHYFEGCMSGLFHVEHCRHTGWPSNVFPGFGTTLLDVLLQTSAPCFHWRVVVVVVIVIVIVVMIVTILKDIRW